MSTLRAEEPLPPGKFTPAHYRRVHRHLFQDAYRWAGRYRTVRTGKGGNWFCCRKGFDKYKADMIAASEIPIDQEAERREAAE